MTLTKDHVGKILIELNDKLAALYGSRLKSVYLYGSYARGEADDDSDIDIAVILAGAVNRAKERSCAGDIASGISLRENCVITLFFMSEAEMAEKPYAIHRSIARDGIPA
ncbi:MAG: nucleotidyltransferase domain-containing protein [Nitrospinae bacterium]|nr:nucleotidyltransferase domain-containing protein [Nitrospinota bacterium]